MEKLYNQPDMTPDFLFTTLFSYTNKFRHQSFPNFTQAREFLQKELNYLDLHDVGHLEKLAGANSFTEIKPYQWLVGRLGDETNDTIELLGYYLEKHKTYFLGSPDTKMVDGLTLPSQQPGDFLVLSDPKTHSYFAKKEIFIVKPGF